MKALAYLFMATIGLFGLPALAADPINAIVAVVNEAPITRLEVERETKRLQQAERSLSLEAAQQQALEGLISRRLQLQRAQQAGVVIPDELLEQRLGDLVTELGLPDAEALPVFAEERFLLPYPQFRERVRDDMQMQALFYREVFLRTKVYEDEINQFLKLEAGVANTREYHLRHILIATAADGSDIDEKQELALSLREQAQAGADFSQLAQEHSNGRLANIGGNMGFITEIELPDIFISEVQNLNEGEISEVIPSSRGFHLLKLEGARGGELREAIKRFRLSHVFFATDAEAQAMEVWQRIKNEEDFLRAVEQHSIDEISIGKGGDIGWFDEEDVPPYFSDAIAQMQAGDISRPLQSPFGWHVLYISEMKDENLGIGQLREQARRVLRERRALAQRDVWLRRLHGDAHVRILDPAFEYNTR